MTPSLAGSRVLIVEDEAMVAMLLEDIVEEIGCTVVGPEARVVHALARLEAEEVDAALLDINLAGERSYPIADALAVRGVPYVFVSGYGSAGLPADYSDRPVIQKPFTRSQLEQALEAVIIWSGRRF
jgi:CheY-like chemotaxis protein